MRHYVYYSYEEWGRGYIGVRSCKCDPAEDSYLGSYRDKTFKPSSKIVLAEFDNRQDAEKAECDLHEFFSVVANPHFVNQVKNTLKGFSRAGAKNSPEHRLKTSIANRGEKNPNYGKPRSEATRQKQSTALRNRKFSTETLERMKRSSANRRKPIALEEMKSGRVYEFESINEAARQLGLNVGNVSNVFTGRQRTVQGYRLTS